jgi:SAM-dependent methyltransferase
MPKPRKSGADKVDIGHYNADPVEYRKLVEELYSKYPPITLPPEYAQFVEENLLRFMIRLARYKFVSRMLKKTDRVLEIGSGSGLGAVFLGQHCAEVTGIEVKASEIKEARELNRRANVKFMKADLFTLPATHQYDCVLALDVIEHMPAEQGRKLVRAMAGQLKESGVVIIGTPSIHSYPYQSPLSKASHVKCYDLPELVELIEGSFNRTLSFSMNDELVHTGHPKLAWYYFVLALIPKA